MRALIGFFALMLAACAPPPEAVRFSILSTESSAATRPDWTPFLNDMRVSTGERVEAYFGPNYSVLIEAMRFEQTHLGWFGNASAMEAVDRSGGEVFAIADRGGYFSVMIARADAGLTLERVLACGGDVDYGGADPQSTSGTLSPNAFLWGPRKLDPQSCFKTVKVANHEANILAVANGLVDVAIVDSSVYERVAARAPEVTAKLANLWTSPRLPDDPLVWRANLDPALKTKIAAFVLAYGQGESAQAQAQRAVLAKLGLKHFRPGDNSHLDSTRALKSWSRLIEARRKNNSGDIAAAEAEVAKLDRNTAPASAP
jgi:phosphonate transport system substrate-binding protein